MSEKSAFEKEYVDPSKQSNVEGLLEHFNLPPKVITFLRENKRAVQLVIAAVIITVVTFSLYGSYRDKKIEQGASALSSALLETGVVKKDALTGVAKDFSGTASGIWASVELAHLANSEKDFAGATKQYEDIHNGLDAANPLYALTLYGVAQGYEAKGSYQESYSAFDKLKTLPGYEFTAYLGMARVLETQEEYEKALGIYGQYLTVFSEDKDAPQRQVVEIKISRIKAKQ